MPTGRLIDLVNLDAYGERSAVARLPDWAPLGDDDADPRRSTLRLFEDGVELGPPHAPHGHIERDGAGFSHWRHLVYFAARDGTSPLGKGRRYTALVSGPGPTRLRELVDMAEAQSEALIGTEAGYALLEQIARELDRDLRLSERGRSYLLDQDFARDYERFDAHSYRCYDRKFAMRELALYAARLPGDMAECGVWRGGTAWLMAKALRAAGRADGRLHLFDSFAGLSTPGATDGANWNAGDLAVSLDQVRENLGPMGDVIQYWPGWIPDQFHHAADRKFSLVHVDVDLAEPTRASLDFFYPRIIDRGLLVCDDYGFETCPGARKAMEEFAAAHGETIIHLPTGQGLIIRNGDAR